MSNLSSRRYFMGAAGSMLGLGVSGNLGLPSHAAEPTVVSPLAGEIRKLVDKTPLMDTHEHLPPEADRVADLKKEDASPSDFGMLFSHYADSDLLVSGMPEKDCESLVSGDLSPKKKWKLLAPWYERCRHTGYLQCVRESVRALYGEEDLREDNCERIGNRMREEIRPGFYRRILRDVANIEHAQINSIDGSVFHEINTDDDLFSYDLSTTGIASGVNRDALNRCAGTEVATLKQAHEAIDRAFEKFGPKAIAVKDQCAYWRRLNFEDVSDADAAPLFERFVREESSLKPEERNALQNNLFRRCLRRATELKLPVKLHTGYAAGYNSMNLAWVRENMSDLARLAKEFPDTTFVLMHIAYPCQQELISLCKHYRNVYADMCWAWIIAPVSSVNFMKAFLTTAPASKLFTFGGDFIPVELVPGHARVARRGMAMALTQLVQEGWLAESDVPDLVERVMRGNARSLYDLARVRRAEP